MGGAWIFLGYYLFFEKYGGRIEMFVFLRFSCCAFRAPKIYNFFITFVEKGQGKIKEKIKEKVKNFLKSF